MLHPAPTSKNDPAQARGTLAEQGPAPATTPAYAVITFDNTSYRTHLVPTDEITSPVGKRIIGTIQARARRVDLVSTGGRYVEPVFGRPRRIQGAVLAHFEDTNTILVYAGMPIHCELTDTRQRPADFPLGEIVSFDTMAGASFTPQLPA